MSQCIFEYALKYTFIPTVIKPPIGTLSQWLRNEEREEEIKLNYCLVARHTIPIQVAHIKYSRIWDTFKIQNDTKREREQGRALTKEGAATLTNGRFKFRVSAMSQTLWEWEKSKSVTIVMKRAKKRDGRKEGGMKQREGWRGEDRKRKRLVESHYAAQWLWPDYSQQRPRGHCPPLGHKPQLSGKLVWSTPGTTPTHWGILRHTNTCLQKKKKHIGCSSHFAPKKSSKNIFYCILQHYNANSILK